MKHQLSTRAMSVGLVALFSTAGVTAASAQLPELKPTGISVDLYRQTLDFDIDKISASIPKLTPAMLEAARPSLGLQNAIDVYGLRVDYQLTPSFNVFAGVGKAEQTTTADFSVINPTLSSIELDQEGVAYSVGGTLMKHFDPIFTALTVVHSRLNLDDNPHDIKALSIAPSAGVLTPIGLVTASLLHQDVDMRYEGSVDVPGIGSIPVDLSATNDQGIQAIVGIKTRLAKDLFLNAHANLNKHEHYQLQINKRF